jgi:hypothetical protein
LCCFSSAEDAQRLCREWQLQWKPICFEVSTIDLMRREQETPFTIERGIALAANKP